MKSLLKKYIHTLLEAIRSNKEPNVQLTFNVEKNKLRKSWGNKFNLNKFIELDNVSDIMAYARQFLEYLGEGSSRTAFILNSRQILKIAKNEKGMAQNEAEITISRNPLTKDIIAKVYNFDTNYQWIIAELVKELDSGEEFLELTGISWMEFSTHVRATLHPERLFDKEISKESEETRKIASKLALAVIETIELNDMMLGDVLKFDHWGKTSDGRVVLLDYGFTDEVWIKHYFKDDQDSEPNFQSNLYPKTSNDAGVTTDIKTKN